MKFNPITKEIFTNSGQFIKKLECPFNMSWNELKPMDGKLSTRNCTNCENLIIDTKNFNDTELLELIQLKPATCFKIDLSQTNLNVVTNGSIQSK